MITFLGGDGCTKITAAANTRIRKLLGGVGGLFTHALNLRYTPGATTHTGTLMRDATITKAASALAAAGTSLVVSDLLYDGDGNAMAASDAIGVKLDNGEWHYSLVTSWTPGTFTAVLTTAIPAGRSVLKGAPVACYGAAGDTYHAANQMTLATGSTFQLPTLAGQAISLCKNKHMGVPLLFDSDNATNAGILDAFNVGYAKR